MKSAVKNLSFLFLLIVILVVANRFHQYYFERNFLINVNSACNPEVESCFSPTCESDELGCEPVPYKMVEIIASAAPSCLEEHTCEDFQCEPGTRCSIQYCDTEVIQEGEECVVPEVSILKETEQVGAEFETKE